MTYKRNFESPFDKIKDKRTHGIIAKCGMRWLCDAHEIITNELWMFDSSNLREENIFRLAFCMGIRAERMRRKGKSLASAGNTHKAANMD